MRNVGLVAEGIARLAAIGISGDDLACGWRRAGAGDAFAVAAVPAVVGGAVRIAPRDTGRRQASPRDLFQNDRCGQEQVGIVGTGLCWIRPLGHAVECQMRATQHDCGQVEGGGRAGWGGDAPWIMRAAPAIPCCSFRHRIHGGAER